MSIFQKIKGSLTLMCVFYTVIISVMFLVGWIMSDSGVLLVPTPSKALLMLVFSMILGFSSLILSRQKTSVLRYVIHYLICTVSFILTFVVGGGFKITGGTSIVAVISFSAVYAAVMIIRGIFCRKYRQQIVDSAEYTSVFK